MMALSMLANLAVLIFAEALLIWVALRRHRPIGIALLVLLNTLLIADLAALVAPRLVYSLTGPDLVAQREEALLEQLARPPTTKHLVIDLGSFGGEYDDPATFRDAFVDPPCADVCQELFRRLSLDNMQINFEAECGDAECTKPGNLLGRGPGRHAWFMQVNRSAADCLSESPCLDTEAGNLKYQFTSNPTREYRLEDVFSVERRQWLTGFAVRYSLTYVWPDEYPYGLVVTLHPNPLLLLPSLGGANQFWNTSIVLTKNYLLR